MLNLNDSIRDPFLLLEDWMYDPMNLMASITEARESEEFEDLVCDMDMDKVIEHIHDQDIMEGRNDYDDLSDVQDMMADEEEIPKEADAIFVDYTGLKLSRVNPFTGELSDEPGDDKEYIRSYLNMPGHTQD